LYNFTITNKKGEEMGFGLIEVSAFITAIAFVGLVYYFFHWSAE
jgi:hypothetical protein